MMQAKSEFARRLRRNQTDAERVLWFRLRDRRLAGWKFKRQVPIDRFVVDFFCADLKLIVELDGGQHDQDREKDADRTRVLDAMGYLVLRFWNNDVLRNIDGVLEEILSTVNQHRAEPPHPTPLPSELGFTRVRHFISDRSRINPTSVGEREHT
jgi:very-short-patch-repair endonuclease